MDNQNMNNNVDNNTNNNTNNNEVNNTNDPYNENNQEPTFDTRDMADKTIDAVEGFIDTIDHKSEFSPEDLKANKTNAMLSYIPYVCFYFIITGKIKNSNYLKFHVNQGLNITIILTAVYLLEKIITPIFAHDSLVLNSTPPVVSFIFYALYFICFLYILFGITSTSNDLSKELPVIGQFKILK